MVCLLSVGCFDVLVIRLVDILLVLGVCGLLLLLCYFVDWCLVGLLCCFGLFVLLAWLCMLSI